MVIDIAASIVTLPREVDKNTLFLIFIIFLVIILGENHNLFNNIFAG